MNLPIEIISYIYQFDPGHREKTTKIHHEMKDIFNTYNKIYWAYKRAYKQYWKILFQEDKNYGQSIYAEWFLTHGYDYNPYSYVLYTLQQNSRNNNNTIPNK